MSKHTPGPWETGGVITRVEFRPPGWNASICVADCDAEHSPDNAMERCANARLIAAAPEMLEIVKVIAKCKDYSELHMDELGLRCKAAIRKATRK